MSKVVYTQQPFFNVFGEVQNNLMEKQQAFQVGTVKLFSVFFFFFFAVFGPAQNFSYVLFYPAGNPYAMQFLYCQESLLYQVFKKKKIVELS